MGFTRSALVFGLLAAVAVVAADSGERNGKGPRSGQDPTSGLQNTMKQLGQLESTKLTSMTHYFTALFALLGKLPTAMTQLVQAKARMDMDLVQSFMDGMAGRQSHGNSDVLSGLRETVKQMGQLEGAKLQSLSQYFSALFSFIALLPTMAFQLGGAKINMDLNIAQSLVNGMTGGHGVQEMLQNMPSDLGDLLGGSGGLGSLMGSGQNGGIGDVLRRLTGGNGSNGGKGRQSNGLLSGMLGGGSGSGGLLSGMMGGGSGLSGPLSGMMGGGSGSGGPLSGMMGGGSGSGGPLSGMMGGGSGHSGSLSGMMGGGSGSGGPISGMMGGASGHGGSLSGMMGSGSGHSGSLSGMMGGGSSEGGSHGLSQGPHSDRLSHFLSGHNRGHQHSSEENKSD